jgi:enamine deaminase RidA (YjgF/YER057c/UK114 family)
VRDGVVQAPGDPYGQARISLQIIAAALAECGAALSDVVRTRIYVTNIAHWAEIGRAHGEVFGDVRPAATMVQVAALITPGLLVEIEADAVVTRP